MLGLGISRYIVERIKRIYEETKIRIRTGTGMTSEFWTTKGLRQGCALSPMLFSLYIADLENNLKKRNIGGVSIGKNRIWSLAYADDLVLLGKNREAMIDMMGSLKRFLTDRGLILGKEKTKIMIFNKSKQCKKENWKWDGQELEEVHSFKYLGFTFNNNCNSKDHITELKKKGITAAKKVWSLGERKCKTDFKRRERLFGYLVRSVMDYGVEVWGWEEKKELEKIKADYFRWILGLDFCTPRYMVYKETGNMKLKTEWGIRALKYEERIIKLGEERLTKQCWEEKRLEENNEISVSKNKFLNSIGLSQKELDTYRELKKNIIEEVRTRCKDIEKQVVDSKINTSKYNPRYREVGTNDIPRYLKEGVTNKNLQTIARLRCGNVERSNKYWLTEKDRQCVLCSKEIGTLNHLLRNCEATKEWTRNLKVGEKDVEALCKEVRDFKLLRTIMIIDKMMGKKEEEVKYKKREKFN